MHFLQVSFDILNLIISFLDTSSIRLLRNVIRFKHNDKLTVIHFINTTRELLLWSILNGAPLLNNCAYFNAVINYFVNTKCKYSLIQISNSNNINKADVNLVATQALCRIIRDNKVNKTKRAKLLTILFNIDYSTLNVSSYITNNIKLIKYLYKIIHKNYNDIITLDLVGNYKNSLLLKQWLDYVQYSGIQINKSDPIYCNTAVQNGNILNLKLLILHNFKCSYESLTIALYGMYGISDFLTVKYLYNRGKIRYELYNEYHLCSCTDCYTCVNKDIRLRQITIYPNSTYDDSNCINYHYKLEHYKNMSFRIGTSDYKCIKYLHKYLYEPILSDVYLYAIREHCIGRIKFLQMLGYPLNDPYLIKYLIHENMYDLCNENIAIEIITYLHNSGCPLYPNIGKDAIKYGLYNVLEYVINKQPLSDTLFCPYELLVQEWNTLLHYMNNDNYRIYIDNYIKCIHVLHANGYKITKNIYTFAITHKNSNLLKLFKELR